MADRRGEAQRYAAGARFVRRSSPVSAPLWLALLALSGLLGGRLDAQSLPFAARPAAEAGAPAASPREGAQAGPTGENPQPQGGTAHGVLEGLGFGVGLTLTQDFGAHDRIEEAEVVNGIVRVRKDRNVISRLMLETHFFFQSDKKFLGRFAEGRWGWGPFVAVQSGEGDIVGAVGTGLMLGFRRETGNNSFNIGVGVAVDPGVRVLGDGLAANQPLPEGETEVRFRETDQWGYLLAFSFSF